MENYKKNQQRYLILGAIIVVFIFVVLPLGVKTGTIPISKGFRGTLAKILPDVLLPPESKETTSTAAAGNQASQKKGSKGKSGSKTGGTSGEATETPSGPYAPPTSTLPNDFIVFVSERDGNREIYGMSSMGKNVLNLSQNPTPEFLPRLAPSKTAIMFVRGDQSDSEIVIMNIDGSNKHQITVDAPVEIFPKWSPNGAKIAYLAKKDFETTLYVIDTDGGNQRKLADGGVITSFSWSPDSQKVAYAQTALDNKSRSTYLVNIDGTDKVKLTGEVGAFDDNPTWFPTGGKVAFVSSSEKTSHQPYLYVVNEDGTDKRTLRGSPTQRFIFSPDGLRIAFEGGEPENSYIGVMNTDGSSEMALTTPTQGQSQIPFMWSSDNSSILLVIYPGGESGTSSDIYIVNSQTKALNRLTTTGRDSQPDW